MGLLGLYRRIYDEFKRNPCLALGSLTALAEKYGLNTEHINKLRQELIGQRTKDLGFIECREYRDKIIEYSAFLSQAKKEIQLVLRISDRINDKRFFDFFMAEDFTAKYCPLTRSACGKISSIIGKDEDEFLKNSKKGIIKTPNFIVRNFGFWNVRDYGLIDEKSKSLTSKAGRFFRWNQQISACTGREKEGDIFILKIKSNLTETKKIFGTFVFKPAVFSYSLRYPFGAKGRQSLRVILTEYLNEKA